MNVICKRQKQIHEVKSDECKISLIAPEIPEVNLDSVSYVIKGFIVFLAVFGTIGFCMSGFHIHYHIIITGFIVLLISMYCAFLYSNKIIMNLGYIVLFISFIVIAYFIHSYVNSGFAAILNQMYDVIDTVYILPSSRHYIESLSDRVVTVTACLCMGSVLYCILVNGAISKNMSFKGLFLLTFPVIQLPLFFYQKPEFGWILMIVVAYMSTVFLKITQNHTRINGNSKWIFYDTRKQTKYEYEAKPSVRIMLQLLLLSCCFLIPLFFCTRFMKSVKIPTIETGSLREKANVRVRDFMISGFSSFFDQYLNAGGIGGGKLGGVGSVRPDYETDLVVQFTPYTKDTIYLKGYTGIEYKNNAWTTIPSYHQIINTSEYKNIISNPNDIHSVFFNGWCLSKGPKYYNNESEILKYSTFKKSMILNGKMKIENKGADTRYLYMPYYTNIKNMKKVAYIDDMVIGSFPYQSKREYEYYCMTDFNRYLEMDENSIFKRQFVEDEYLYLPDEISGELEKFCNKAGFYGSQKEIISQVQLYLENNYMYSMSPGITPKNTDYVMYFLNKQRKGFCAHFATAATLIFRKMGIPARYCEGYVIPYYLVKDGELVKGEDYEKWMKGKNPLGKTSVVKVEVNDSNAHAWVEVFVEGFGWIPIEVTTAPMEINEDSQSGFWDIFARNFGDTNSDIQSLNQNVFENFTLTKQTKNAIKEGFYRLIVIAVILMIIGFVIIRIKKVVRIYIGSPSEKVISQYQYINRILIQKKLTDNHFHGLVSETVSKINCLTKLDTELIARWGDFVLQVSYDNKMIHDQEIRFCNLMFWKIRGKLFFVIWHKRIKRISLYIKKHCPKNSAYNK